MLSLLKDSPSGLELSRLLELSLPFITARSLSCRVDRVSSLEVR
jgi:hypothetical protein